VSKERGEHIAREHAIRFLETSAKANINIDKAFYDLAEAILEKMPSGDSSGAANTNITVNRPDSGERSRCC